NAHCVSGSQYGDKLRDAMLANWLFTPIDYFKNGVPPPCNGTDGMWLEMAIDEQGNEYLAFTSGNDPKVAGAAAKISVNCNCICNIKCLHDIDDDGVCDE